jgi:predicted nucleic acid-binding protein
MVVVDSSALIPLAWVGELDLITARFDEIRTTEDVRDEVLTKGKRGAAVLNRFLADVTVHQRPSDASEVASLEGIAAADASVLLLASDRAEILLANDKGLIEVARSHDVECWWVTTLLLNATADGVVTSTEATEILYALVDEGMNLHPRVYARLQKKLQGFDN